MGVPTDRFVYSILIPFSILEGSPLTCMPHPQEYQYAGTAVASRPLQRWMAQLGATHHYEGRARPFVLCTLIRSSRNRLFSRALPTIIPGTSCFGEAKRPQRAMIMGRIVRGMGHPPGFVQCLTPGPGSSWTYNARPEEKTDLRRPPRHCSEFTRSTPVHFL